MQKRHTLQKQIILDALKELGIGKKHIERIIKENKSTLSQVFLLQLDREMNYTIIKKDEVL